MSKGQREPEMKWARERKTGGDQMDEEDNQQLKTSFIHIYPPPSAKFTISPPPPPSYVPGWAHAVAGTGNVGPA